MKHINKYILMTSALLLAGTAFADDFGDFGGFDDEASSGTGSALEVSGTASLEGRAYVDTKDDEEVEVKGLPAGKLDLSYSGNNSDFLLSLSMDAEKIKANPEDIIDELVLRGRLNDYLTLEAGKMKVVWGKGDKLHVLDNFNADNYSDFIIPDYLDRRVSTPMVRGIISLPVANLNVEGVYTPLLPTDRFALDGRWMPAQVGALKTVATASATNYVKTLVTDCETYRTGLAAATTLAKSSQEQAKAYAAAGDLANAQKYAAAAKKAAAEAESYKSKLTAADTAYTMALNNAGTLADNIYPDLWTLKYGQFGGRATWTLCQVDMGISYYNGWYKQPSFNGEKLDKYIKTYLANGKVSEDDKFLAYDKKQTFGVEASSIIWHFNVRGEFAYNLTDDSDGTNPWVHNNSIGWLGGFDIDLPFANANLNVQETGTLILKGDECDKNHDDQKADVDYGVNGYTNNKIVANLTTSFMNDKVLPEVTVLYGIENKDLVVMPKLSYKADQNFTLIASGMIINCGDDNSEFKAWEKNSFVSVGAKYQF